MTIISPTPTRAPFDQDRVRSKSPLSVDWTRGVMTATTGQTATVTRAAPNALLAAGNEILHARGTNRARILHHVRDTSNVLRGGLLVEGARTNLFERSQNFSNAYWTKTQCSITSSAVIAPDGTMTGDIAVASTDAPRVIRNPTLANNTTYTVSAYVRMGPRYVAMRPSNNAGTQFTARFDLALGINDQAPASPAVARIERAALGWWRISVTFPSESGAGVTDFRVFQNTAGEAGDGWGSTRVAGMPVWGAQLEAGSFASTYIPTVASTVTRATDQVSYANFPQPAEIAARGGITIYWAGVDLGAGLTQAARLWRVGDGVAANTSRQFEIGTSSGALFLSVRNGLDTSSNSTFSWPATGSFLQLACNLEYRVQAGTPQFRTVITRSVDNAAPVTAPAGEWLDATDLITNGWQTSPTLYVGARDGGSNPSFALHQQFKTAFGVQAIDTMRGLI